MKSKGPIQSDGEAIFVQYARDIAEQLSVLPEQVTLAWKGRVALYLLLKSAGVGPGDEVVIPGYTCVVVPSAIIYLGAKPVYVDIDPDTYTSDFDAIRSAVSSKCKVVILQSTYGIQLDPSRVDRLVGELGVTVIEDATHSYSPRRRGEKGATRLAARFYSTQWNKVFSTGLGGFAVTFDKSLATAMRHNRKELKQPSPKAASGLRFQMSVRERLGYGNLFWMSRALYREMAERNIITGSSGGGELASPRMPERYLLGCSQGQARQGRIELDRIWENLANRRAITERYCEFLAGYVDLSQRQIQFLRGATTQFPLLVVDRNAVLEQARSHRIPLGDWFVSPLHPIDEGLDRWQYRRGACPIAERISRHVINLPTDRFVRPAIQARILKFVGEISDQLMSVSECISSVRT